MARNAKTAWMVAAASGLLGACTAVGPDYEVPETTAGEMEEWNGKLEGAIRAEELDPAFLASWWTSLEDPLLSSLIEEAANANLDLKTAGAQLRQARAQLQGTQAQGLPSLSASGQAQQTRTGDVESDLFTVGLDASWELDLFGRIDRQVEAAQADLETVQEARRDVLISVLAEVALSYIDLRTVQRQKQLAEENLALQLESQRIVEAQEQAGATDRLDLERAISSVESTRAILPALEQQLRQSQNRLAVLLGKNPGALDSLLEESARLPVPPVQVAVGVPAEVLRRRPDVRRSERQLAAETARVGVAVSELYPRFSMGGTIGLQSDSTGSLFDSASRLFSLGPRVQWNLFNGGAIRQQIEAQNAVQERALLQYEQTILLALEEVDNAIVAFTEERIRYQSLLAASTAAENAARLAKARYDAGSVDFLAVLDAQRTQLQTQDQVAASEGLILSNLVRLYKGLGGGWDSTGNEG